MKSWTSALAGMLLAVLSMQPVRAGEPVEMELLLAVDVSYSISEDEHALQVAGIAAAFRAPQLVDAITAHGDGRIAVAVMYWAGEDQQRVAVPWHLIANREDAARFASVVEANAAKPWPGITYTAIGSALLQGARAIETNGFDGRRRVIDLSADDPSNQGFDTAAARDRTVALGITVNGLPILANRHETEEREELVRHFEDEVIGGRGAFVLPAQSFRDVPRALASKLVTEVSGIAPAGRVLPVNYSGGTSGSYFTVQPRTEITEIRLLRAGSSQTPPPSTKAVTAP